MRSTLAAVAAVSTLLSGCAAKMAMAPGATTLDLKGEGMVLLTSKVTNTYKETILQTKTVGVRSVLSEAQKKAAADAQAALPPGAEADSGQGFRIFETGEATAVDETPGRSFDEHVVVVSLPPGRYQLTGLTVEGGSFLMKGFGVVQLEAPFEVTAGAVTCLGRVEAVRRERTGDEPRAGSVIPLISQAALGFSGGTFDLTVVDRYDADLAQARAIYPALGSVQVGKALLVPTPPRP
jgi:hypothetical protein